jgi:hypothetical protein
MAAGAEGRLGGREGEASPLPAGRAAAVAACLAEYLVPGTGYLLLGRLGRGLAAMAGIAFLFVWGLMLDGQLDRPEPNQVLSYLATFASRGVGVAYWVVAQSEGLGNGRGDVTSATFEMGTTFLRAAGLIGYLLVLDVYDIAVGRKG